MEAWRCSTLCVSGRFYLLATLLEGWSKSYRTALWDFVFYGSFGLVVTSSVAHAGVLLVFSFLIIPAIVGTLASQHLAISLLAGWLSGALATLIGLAASVTWDTPTGPTLVVSFAVVLLLTVPILAGVRRLRTGRAILGRQVILGALGLTFLAILAQGAWLIAAPASDQPLLSVFEQATGLGPDVFMTPAEQAIFRDAADVGEAILKRLNACATLNGKRAGRDRA